MKKTVCILLIAVAGSAGAAPQVPGSNQPTMKRQAPALNTPAVRVIRKPDIQPVEPVISANRSSTSGYPPGIGRLNKRLFAKNNGPGELKSSFRWRVTCQVVAKEFPLGPCFYNSYQNAVNAQSAYPTVTTGGAMYNLPAAAGEQVWHQLITNTFLNCRHEQGGKCYIKLEVDDNNKVDETNEGNNEVNLVWQ